MKQRDARKRIKAAKHNAHRMYQRQRDDSQWHCTRRVPLRSLRLSRARVFRWQRQRRRENQAKRYQAAAAAISIA